MQPCWLGLEPPVQKYLLMKKNTPNTLTDGLFFTKAWWLLRIMRMRNYFAQARGNGKKAKTFLWNLIAA